MKKPETPFTFLDYAFYPQDYTAHFRYRGQTNYEEIVQFAKPQNPTPVAPELLDRALFLAFILIGTSYYKSHPTREVFINRPLDPFQAGFFTTVYQDGLSQFAFENHLARKDLAVFIPTVSESTATPLRLPDDYRGVLSLQSGGKDSLLLSKLLSEHLIDTPWTTEAGTNGLTFWFLSSSNIHPAVLDRLGRPLQTALRIIDKPHLELTKGKTGHVPITYIVESLALIQAILNHQKAVAAAIGREGEEPHAIIHDNKKAETWVGQSIAATDLPVNHQWSKTAYAESLLQTYIRNYISPDFLLGSPLRNFTELEIAKLFAEHCWNDYGRSFSSCNVANYKQGELKRDLTWCGHCAKCANSYLLFAPFIPREELDSLFKGKSLFEEPSLKNDFKGLLGYKHHMKPLECVGSVAELREAYRMKRPEYPNLSFMK